MCVNMLILSVVLFILVMFDVDGMLICVFGVDVNKFYKDVFVYGLFEVYGIDDVCGIDVV